MQKVGYLVNTDAGPTGEKGIFYDYILAGNGVFVRAENALIKATISISEPVTIRGLPPLQQSVELKHGRIPGHLYELALSVFIADPRREQIVVVVWDGEYHLRVPVQQGTECSVHYETLPATVAEIHSHGMMSAFFSGTDNQNEKGLCLYGVVGNLDRLIPEINMRIGVYGYFEPLNFSEVFSVSTI
jgi:PRTRC genetic system protein A